MCVCTYDPLSVISLDDFQWCPSPCSICTLAPHFSHTVRPSEPWKGPAWRTEMSVVSSNRCVALPVPKWPSDGPGKLGPRRRLHSHWHFSPHKFWHPALEQWIFLYSSFEFTASWMQNTMPLATAGVLHPPAVKLASPGNLLQASNPSGARSALNL